MSTSEARPPIKPYVRNNRKRKMAFEVDLNVTPGEVSEEIHLHVEIPLPVQAVEQGHVGNGTEVSVPGVPATIDVEAIDDDVVISSPRRFAEARKKSRRNSNVPGQDSRTHSGNSEEEITRLSLNNYNMRRRIPPNLTIIDCEQYINLESIDNTEQATRNSQVAVQSIPPPAPPPPKEPSFNCPVCIGPLVEASSTKCGHIFCKMCIKACISKQTKCPTCRRKVTMKEVFRVYLPAAS